MKMWIRIQISSVYVVILFLALGSAAAASSRALVSPVETHGPWMPFPQHVSYFTGSILPDHVDRETMDETTRRMYDDWKENYLAWQGREEDGHPRFRVKTGREGNEPTVSEAQGYGMVITAFMAGYDPMARVIFDGLWEFALDHPSDMDGRLMDWYVNADESPDPYGDDSAFDGDSDMAYALLLASGQWGDYGRFDYKAEAVRVIGGIMESTIGPDSGLPMLGDWVDPFGMDYNQWTPRSSDFMPGHFHAFAEVTGDENWNSVLDSTLSLQEQMISVYSSETGLLPDFMVPGTEGLKPAEPFFLEGPFDGNYYYNACRDPWRSGIYALSTGDVDVIAQLRLLGGWLFSSTGGDPVNIKAGYYLNGVPLPGSNYLTAAFAAPMAVAAMTDSSMQDYLNELYDLLSANSEDYYEDSIALLCMLIITGNWWQP